jgi:hypothetical protein
MSFMSARVATEVPDWKVLDSRMNAPSLLGTSSTVPSIVAGIMLDTLPELLLAPVLSSSNVSSADATACFCRSKLVTYWLNCDSEMTFCSSSFL